MLEIMLYGENENKQVKKKVSSESNKSCSKQRRGKKVERNWNQNEDGVSNLSQGLYQEVTYKP